MPNPVHNHNHNGVNGVNQTNHQKKPFNADDAVIQALNSSINQLYTATGAISAEGQLATTLRETAVQNSLDRVNAEQILLQIQGDCSGQDNFNKLKNHGSFNSIQDLINFLPSVGATPQLIQEIQNLSPGDQNLLLNGDGSFTGVNGLMAQAHGDLQTFQGLSSVISQQVNTASKDEENVNSLSQTFQSGSSNIAQSMQEEIAEASQQFNLYSAVIAG